MRMRRRNFGFDIDDRISADAYQKNLQQRIYEARKKFRCAIKDLNKVRNGKKWIDREWQNPPQRIINAFYEELTEQQGWVDVRVEDLNKLEDEMKELNREKRLQRR